jgi:purine-nucleoside phosphorylase
MLQKSFTGGIQLIDPYKVTQALKYLQEKIRFCPDAGVVLGSGLGGVADAVENPISVPYGEIPFWPVSTAPGHAGRLIAGNIGQTRIVAMQGRVHYYEGYPMDEVVFPVRVFGEWGIKVYFATNASGGVNTDLLPGDLVLLEDHLNLMGVNPLVGPNDEKWGPRFPDMTFAYDRQLRELVTRVGDKVGVPVKSGVYAAFSGPSFETPAEIRMVRALGGDVVGMSTVPEVIVANHMGMRVCALSCVANYAAGMTDNPLTHEEVLAEMGKASERLSRLGGGALEELGRR